MGFLLESMKWLLGSLSLWMPSKSPGYCPPATLCRLTQHTSAFWTEREGNGPLWQHSAQRGELRTHSHLPRGIQQGLSRLLLALELCCLRGGMTKVKRNHSSHSLQCTEPWIIYCCYSTDVWNFSTDSQASTEARLSMEDCQNWCSLGEGWWNTATCHFDHIA